MEDNELIAIFMGWRIEGEPEFTKPYEIWVSETGARMYPRTDPQGNRYPDEFKFHTSWDWLMPVVISIEELEEPHPSNDPEKGTVWPYQVEILSRNVIQIIDNITDEAIVSVNKDGLTKIQAAYKAVVEFIKWYNQQKQ